MQYDVPLTRVPTKVLLAAFQSRYVVGDGTQQNSVAIFHSVLANSMLALPKGKSHV